ncbi:MAG: enolase C-terminal domain-like protein, partial [Hyphomonas sp.]
DLPAMVASAARLGVVMIEQPFPAGKDAALMRRPGAVAICADESAHTSADIQTLARSYDAVNVKLDKAGGLTEALAMVRAARTAGMVVMVGCMVAGSLSMAPAVLLAQLADAADLDGPLWLASDIEGGLVYTDGQVLPPGAALWG